MNEQQIELVKKSWLQVMPISDAAGELFYKMLFEAAPGVRHLFKSDVKVQSAKLMMMINMVVSRLDRLDTLMEDIKALAVRHNKYGARPEHYEVVGQTLIRTLEIGLGDQWNEKTQSAWVAAYSILSEAMIQGQQQDLIKEQNSKAII